MACFVALVNSLRLVMSISCLWIKYTRDRLGCQAPYDKIMQLFLFTFCSMPLPLPYALPTLWGYPPPPPLP
jgi:hypothetical protein